MLTFQRPLVVIDIETTDLSLGPPQMVELGAVYLSTSLEVVRTFERVVRPPDLDWYSEYSENLIGIPKEDIKNAQMWEIWKEFADFTEYRNTTLAAWGAYFDIPVLRDAYSTLGLGYPHRGEVFDVKSAVMLYFGWMGMKTANKSFALKEVCNRLHIKQSTRHRALPDAMNTVKILQTIQSNLEELENERGTLG